MRMPPVLVLPPRLPRPPVPPVQSRRARRKVRRGINKRASSASAAIRSGRTFSVLPPHRLPYRPIRAERLQGAFDQRAGIQTQGLDPPPRAVEEGCQQRAWRVLTTRVATLKDAFGQLVDSTVSDGLSLWKSLRESFDSVAKMLRFLSEHHHISLLGDYRCLRPDG